MIKDAKVYVSTYAKYNNGSLKGEWLSLSDYYDKDEFLEACQELHSDEEDPEFVFQDWEYIPDGFISESNIEEELFEMIQEGKGFSGFTQNAFFAYLEHFGKYGSVQDFLEKYIGGFDSERDFAKYIIDETQPDALSDFAKSYFDYEAYARDLFMGDFLYLSGFVFRDY